MKGYIVKVYLKGDLIMSLVIKATKREPGARSKLSQLRQEGQLAGVIYGFNTESTPILLNYKETEKTVRKNGYAAVFQIELEGKKINAVLSEIQRDAIKGRVKHVDFLAINMKEELEIDVTFHLVGDAVGVREGGVLTQPNHTIKIKVKPADIPENLEIDVAELGIGDTLSLGAIRDQFDFEILSEDDYTLATVAPPAPKEEEADTAEAEKTADDVEATGEKLSPEKPGRED
jgi:large subunit ribosomal protein L25